MVHYLVKLQKQRRNNMEKNLDFKKELDRLNEIVGLMQNDDLPLEESVKLYEEGNKIIALLNEALKDAEENIEKIVEINKK